MYCPQCGTESNTGQQYCRLCGANLKVIAKAVTLSEAIARSDRGPLPRIKEMIKSMKVEHVTEEVSRALDQMNTEIARSTPASKPAKKPKKHSPLQVQEDETPEQRRENHLVKGTISFFTGIALMIFLYYFASAIVLKIPPDQLARIPFDLEPLIRTAWLIGLIPTLSGLGRITAGLLISPAPVRSIDVATPESQQIVDKAPEPQALPESITEHTTEMLERKLPLRQTNEIKE